jgi:tryptophanyl-tRNA synthetase
MPSKLAHRHDDRGTAVQGDESDMNSTEEKLRERIRKAFSQSTRPLTDTEAQRLEKEVLALIEAYFRAPQQDKEKIYAENEESLLNTIRSFQVNSQERSSSGHGRW